MKKPFDTFLYYLKKIVFALIEFLVGMLPWMYFNTMISTIAYTRQISSRQLWMNNQELMFLAFFAALWLMYWLIKIMRLGWKLPAEYRAAWRKSAPTKPVDPHPLAKLKDAKRPVKQKISQHSKGGHKSNGKRK